MYSTEGSWACVLMAQKKVVPQWLGEGTQKRCCPGG